MCLRQQPPASWSLLSGPGRDVDVTVSFFFLRSSRPLFYFGQIFRMIQENCFECLIVEVTSQQLVTRAGPVFKWPLVENFSDSFLLLSLAGNPSGVMSFAFVVSVPGLAGHVELQCKYKAAPRTERFKCALERKTKQQLKRLDTALIASEQKSISSKAFGASTQP